MNHDEPPGYDSTDAHYEALYLLPEDERARGALSFSAYAERFYRLLDRPYPSANSALIRFLNAAPKIANVASVRDELLTAYEHHGIIPPAGVEGLPAWWGPPLAHEINDANWVEDDPVRVADIYGWRSVGRSGAFLDICYGRSIPRIETRWSEVGAELMNLHHSLEPGPFTSPARLSEFF